MAGGSLGRTACGLCPPLWRRGRGRGQLKGQVISLTLYPASAALSFTRLSSRFLDRQQRVSSIHPTSEA